MVWAILAAVGVPLWLCAAGILTLVFRNRSLRKRPGDIPVRMRTTPGGRWSRGHGVWIHDVFLFRGSPAAWNEQAIRITALSTRAADPHQPWGPRGLHKLGDKPVVASLFTDGGRVVEFATRADRAALLSGPFEPVHQEAVAREHAPT